jgi:phosphate starvation-inducible PhoH-like protein
LTDERVERRIRMATNDEVAALFGNFDENLKTLESELDVSIAPRESDLVITGQAQGVELAAEVIDKLGVMLKNNERVDKGRIRYAIELAREGNADLITEIMTDVLIVTHRGKQVKCKTVGQKKLVNAVRANTMVFAVGPAGTGKTYLAMAMAVVALKNKDVSRIVLTRPAVEAGEKLGFLPGDLQNKVDPYLRPLYDALYEMIGTEAYARLLERGIIEVAPMAYMRGRTLNDAFVVLDEAQNTSVEQMKMFLTRLGQGSKMIINGDITQIDLPPDKRSGLVDAIEVLRDVKDIAVVRLTARDVVRHELVQSIINAYEAHGRKNPPPREARRK